MGWGGANERLRFFKVKWWIRNGGEHFLEQVKSPPLPIWWNTPKYWQYPFTSWRWRTLKTSQGPSFIYTQQHYDLIPIPAKTTTMSCTHMVIDKYRWLKQCIEIFLLPDHYWLYILCEEIFTWVGPTSWEWNEYTKEMHISLWLFCLNDILINAIHTCPPTQWLIPFKGRVDAPTMELGGRGGQMASFFQTFFIMYVLFHRHWCICHRSLCNTCFSGNTRMH